MGPTAWTDSEHQEQIALLFGVEAIERQGVVTHDHVRVQGGLFAHHGQVAQRLGRHRCAVADVAAEDHHVIGAANRDLSPQQRDHPAALASAIDRGAQLAWHIATASASAA